MSGMPGGLTESRPAGQAEQEVADKIRAEIESKESKTFSEFAAVSYKTQVVAGINYYIKVKVGENDYIHVKIYRDLSQAVSLTGYQTGKAVNDPIEFF